MSGWKWNPDNRISISLSVYNAVRTHYIHSSMTTDDEIRPALQSAAGHGTVSLLTNEPPVRSRLLCMGVACVHRHLWRFSLRFFAMRSVAKRYILQKKCLKRKIGTCLLGTRWCNFSRVQQP